MTADDADGPRALHRSVDVDYEAFYSPLLAPDHLDLAALINGVAPPRHGPDTAWCELGCGRGVSAVITAASRPRHRFCAIDFMPAHIAQARALAEAAGVSNLDLIEADFAEAAARADGPFDYIVAHGVYSWIDAAGDAGFLDFIDRHLAPGGLLYISYNAMPGWAADLPVRRLMPLLAARTPGRSDARAAAAQAAIAGLVKAGAAALKASPTAGRWSSDDPSPNARYLAHEYLVPGWRAFYVDEVRATMRGIGLHPAGSAALVENFDRLMMTGAARAALEAFADDAELHALLRSYIINENFRRDIFVRGDTAIDAGIRRDRLLDMRFELLQPMALTDYSFATPAGRVRFDNVAARAIVTRLAEGIAPLAACTGDGTGPDEVIANALMLCCAGAIAPVGDGAGDPNRLTTALLAHARGEDGAGLVALDGGTALRFDAAFLNALGAGKLAEHQRDWPIFLQRHAGAAWPMPIDG